MKRALPTALLLAIFTVASIPAPVAAQHDVPRNSLRGGDRQDSGKRGFSRDDAAERARRQTGGRVLSIREGERDEGEGYRVKVLTPEGEVRYIFVEPNGKGRR